MIRFFAILMLSFLLNPVIAFASHDRQLDELLASKTEIDGVVFEVISRRSDYLNWAIIEIEKMSEQLRKRFPDIQLAVVSHSREQFALATGKREEFQGLHKKVQSLVVDKDIPVHVCGINAERKGLDAGDFPAYVDVSESGPIQIGIYKEMGYKVILITRH